MNVIERKLQRISASQYHRAASRLTERIISRQVHDSYHGRRQKQQYPTRSIDNNEEPGKTSVAE